MSESVYDKWRATYGEKVLTPSEQLNTYRQAAQNYYNNRLTDLKFEFLSEKNTPQYKGLEPNPVDLDDSSDEGDNNFKKTFGVWERDEPDTPSEEGGRALSNEEADNRAQIETIVQIQKELKSHDGTRLSPMMKKGLGELLARERRRLEMTGQNEMHSMVEAFYKEAWVDDKLRNPNEVREEVLGVIRVLLTDSSNFQSAPLYFALDKYLRDEELRDKEDKDRVVNEAKARGGYVVVPETNGHLVRSVELDLELDGQVDPRQVVGKDYFSRNEHPKPTIEVEKMSDGRKALISGHLKNPPEVEPLDFGAVVVYYDLSKFQIVSDGGGKVLDLLRITPPDWKQKAIALTSPGYVAPEIHEVFKRYDRFDLTRRECVVNGEFCLGPSDFNRMLLVVLWNTLTARYIADIGAPDSKEKFEQMRSTVSARRDEVLSALDSNNGLEPNEIAAKPFS